MEINGLVISGRACLAPMAGVSDRAFRELCTSYGAAYTVTEMVSSKGLGYGDRKSGELLEIHGAERPCGAQLFGNVPEIMADAAKKAELYSPDFIDINMGCPAPKVANHNGGSSLMRTPALAGEIVAAVRSAVKLPLTVKIRAGWDDDTKNAPELAKICEDAGADAITVHGRTRMQMYAPPVDYDIIALVKNAVNIPVIGNGDVTDGKSAALMYERTNCDLVMVGRGALGRPWVFSEIEAYLAHETVLPEPPVTQRMLVMLRHAESICAYKGEYIGIREIRKHAAWYVKGIPGGAKFRKRMSSADSLDDLRQTALELCGS